MYSLVFASDMYATVFKKDPLDPARGRLYREKILRVGGSRDDLDSLKVGQDQDSALLGPDSALSAKTPSPVAAAAPPISPPYAS